MSTGLPPGVLPNVKIFGPGANCTLDICPVEMSVYGYRPDLAANITFLALYLISAAIHVYLGFRWKTWFFMICMVFGAANAVLGYAGRIVMYYNPFNFAAFMVQIICITSGPVYYSAAIYVTLAAAIKYFSPSLSRFQPNLFYWIFIPCDVVCLIFQAVGGALSTASAGSSQIGVDMALVGLSLQVVVMVAFCAFFADYLIRYFRAGSTERFGTRAKLFFGFMALAIVLILVRCSYRLVELRNGYRGELIRDEPIFIGLEGVMVISAVFCLMISHPGFVFKNNVKEDDSESTPQSFEMNECHSTFRSRI
ncbi:Parasitic phase-specific protein PSP-1 [Colletotrichum higginsianum IMI 349063]|uniref:Parasitic phase-specific protein PSP-1 n=2 Tax=Colletotrichum higginsianum TaxID=80884 RepID=A0A1B7XYG5_COLHI|nr:Parasitic phase-specific protein PSP-1 [Colletotrichum higginsianum IMI 349063]OBR04789.1 Parasitic phase-specific protein PSP-1 [Colletotrichum higginsianum IMI 349063]TIC94160.1 Sphingoid long-chain base transporter RSB1 [Colletotrichum higginsianum]